ncbi:MAG: hypothetical protein QOD71_1768 [Thermoleophilaceae bacterium]|jgi:hypothetical protein|nr:hypothetical protein [Thermoleophilaceae bacterium]
MDTDATIACSLSADELPKRLEQIGAVGRDSLLSVSADGELRFRAGADTRDRLEAIVAAESECCSFLSFDLRENAGDLVLTISGSADAEAVVSNLVRAFGA